MTTTKKAAIAAGVAAAALIAAYYATCSGLRFTKEDMRELRRSTSKAVAEAAAKSPDDVLPLFEKMASEEVWRARYAGDSSDRLLLSWFPLLSKERKVPIEHISGLVEDVFIKFAGSGFPDAAAQGRIKKLITFAEKIEPQLGPDDARSLRERLLDAHFVVNDFDGAVSILEKGLPGHSENWCKAAIAKIRAHQAEERKDDAEALKQFTAFGEAMAAEPDNGIPEFDPATGVAYCRAWVLAKNARRCATYAKNIGKDEESAAFLAKAKELYEKAVKDTEDDEKSIAVLRKEMSEAGL